MKKIKTGLFFIILIFCGWIIYINNDYFLKTYQLIIDLKIKSWQWQLPAIMNIGYFGIFFCLGFVVAGYIGVSSKFKSRKIIKQLNHDISLSNDQIASLKTELDKFRNDPYINSKSESKNNGDQVSEQQQTT